MKKIGDRVSEMMDNLYRLITIGWIDGWIFGWMDGRKDDVIIKLEIWF